MKFIKFLIATLVSISISSVGFAGDKTGINKVPDGPTKVEKA